MNLSLWFSERDIRIKEEDGGLLSAQTISSGYVSLWQWVMVDKVEEIHSESNSCLQLIPELLGEEKFLIGTMWSIRGCSSAIIIFMLGFIADVFTLHRADNGMRISPPHWLCSFNPWNEQLMQRRRGNQVFIYFCPTPLNEVEGKGVMHRQCNIIRTWRFSTWMGCFGQTLIDIDWVIFYILLVSKSHEKT